MTPERGKIPEWAHREHRRDFEWIRENLDSFWPFAKDVFQELGRGLIVVDTTSQPTGEGHPYGYFPRQDIEKAGDEDTTRIMGNYNPEEEFVILLIKPGERTSTYRIKPVTPDPKKSKEG
jgi:hypothetical protein